MIVQLSTGTPKEAREQEAWVRQRGADYLDGAIAAVPRQMGRPETTIFVSGSRRALDKSEPLLKHIAGNVPYLGTEAGAAAAFDLGFLSYLFGSFLGFLHGARILEAEGLRVDALGSMLSAIAPVSGEMIRGMGEAVQQGEFTNPESSIATSAAGMQLFVRQAHEANINGEFPAFASRMFQRAVDEGYGDEKVAALIKVLRRHA
jgi:3-hydroxyisobutyrate dehydrogenase-like beta-hydroxyacid dehydrogenase